MIENRKAQLKFLISLSAILLLVLIFVFAQNNDSLDNATEIAEESIDEPLSIDGSEENTSEIPPIAGEIVNEAVQKEINNDLVSDTQESAKKKLPEIIEEKRHKLNDETASELETLSLEDDRKFIVKHKSSYDKEKLDKFEKEKDIKDLDIITIDGKVKDIGEILEDDEIEYLELDQDINPLEDAIGYNIEKVKAPQAWNLSKGNGVKVAVLDTGIASHPDLTIAGGYSVVSGSYEDTHGHGTLVAGVLAATLNEEGIVGVAPEASLYAIKIMEGSSGSLSDAIAGLEWTIDNDMDIVSMSFGFDSYSQIFKDVLEEAYEDEGILLIAASGNEGTDEILYPAAYDSVIAVGSVDENNALAASSSYGFDQELVAPGVNIYSTSLINGYVSASGTSLATPNVAGIAALIWAHNHSLSNEQVRAKLRNDALDLGSEGRDDYFGYGLVQADLESDNFTFVNDSYFYEIFNITDFKLPSEERDFWTSGTGSINDVDFEEGTYLVRKLIEHQFINKIYLINENGSLETLSIDSIGYIDDYTGEGSSAYDGVVWINGDLAYNISGADPERDAECFDNDNNDGAESCYYKSGKFSQCDTFSNGGVPGSDQSKFHEVCQNVSATCSVGVPHEEDLTVDTRGFFQVEITEYLDCDNSVGMQSHSGENDPGYYVINQKRAICDDNVNYHYEGKYDTSSWVSYKSATCNGFCDQSLDEVIVTTEGGTIPNPCATACNGTIDVAVQVSYGTYDGYFVKRNGIDAGTTDSSGVERISLSSATCGQDQNISVYCKDDSTKICEFQLVTLDDVNDARDAYIDCSVCNNERNLEVSIGNVGFNLISGTTYQVNVTVLNSNAAGSFNITIKKVDKTTGLLSSNEVSSINSISSSDRTKSYQLNVDLNNVDYVYVYVDAKNDIVAEENELDNFVVVPFVREKPNAYLVVGTGNTKANEAIENYLKLFVNSVSEASADIIIAVGNPDHNSKVASLNGHTRINKRFHFDKTAQYASKSVSTEPYGGLVGRFISGGKLHVFAYGNGLEGDIAAVKKLISVREQFLDTSTKLEDWDISLITRNLIIIDNYDSLAMGVMELMQADDARRYYMKESGTDGTRFRQVVENILNDNTYDTAIQTVQTLTTSYGSTEILRLKHLNSDHSDNYRDAVLKNTKPVVLSGGIFSNLETFQNGLGGELAELGYDTWTIEMTGNPAIEEYNGKDYTYDDLVDYYWPALMGGVRYYTGKNQFDYIGHSNGCRVAVSALDEYFAGKSDAGDAFNDQTGAYDIQVSLPVDLVDKFFGIGCPATLNDETHFTEKAREITGSNYDGNLAIISLNKSGTGPRHVLMKDYSTKVDPSYGTLISPFDSGNKISLNLMSFYNTLAINTNSPTPGTNMDVNEFYVLSGEDDLLPWPPFEDDDGIVHPNDGVRLLNTINAPVEAHMIYGSSHSFIDDDFFAKQFIKYRLKN